MRSYWFWCLGCLSSLINGYQLGTSLRSFSCYWPAGVISCVDWPSSSDHGVMWSELLAASMFWPAHGLHWFVDLDKGSGRTGSLDSLAQSLLICSGQSDPHFCCSALISPELSGFSNPSCMYSLPECHRVSWVRLIAWSTYIRAPYFYWKFLEVRYRILILWTTLKTNLIWL